MSIKIVKNYVKVGILATVSYLSFGGMKKSLYCNIEVRAMPSLITLLKTKLLPKDTGLNKNK